MYEIKTDRLSKKIDIYANITGNYTIPLSVNNKMH